MNPDQVMRRILFLPNAATDFATSIDHLHFFVITVTMLGSAAVFLVALYFIIRYGRTEEPPVTPIVQASKKVEAFVICSLLGLFILWWVIGFLQYISYATPPRDADDVYVIAKQWMWKFAYPNGRSTIGALVVPVDRDIRLVMTSRDVIHSFYVPAFRFKRDVLPGRYTNAWFRAKKAGIFDIFCAEFCGKLHSRMRANVIVLSKGDYEQWLGGKVPPLLSRAATLASLQGIDMRPEGETTRSMAEQGRQAASKNGCFACHTIDGQTHIGPTWQSLYGQLVELEGGRRLIADEEYLTRSMMDPMVDVVRGYRPVMPTYLGTLRQPDAAAIVEFIKSLNEPPSEPRVTLPKAEVIEPDAGLPGAAVGVRSPAPFNDGGLRNQQPKSGAPVPITKGVAGTGER